MRTQERKVSAQSDYYVYSPSTLAQKIYLYPLSVGHYIYEPDYQIYRSNFDSFLIMYIVKGSCSIQTGQHTDTAKANEFVLLDCYTPHSYGSADAWEAVWLHFDGPLARTYYQEITSHYGYVLTPANAQTVSCLLKNIYLTYRNAMPIMEAALSETITAILNELFIPKSDTRKKSMQPAAVAEIIAYINEHFSEQISLSILAAKANLSPYHFTRVFTLETGFTPHQYLLKTRISAAEFLLKTSETSVKDIAFSTGFQSESHFCTAFKKWAKMTPSEYRQHSFHSLGSKPVIP